MAYYSTPCPMTTSNLENGVNSYDRININFFPNFFYLRDIHNYNSGLAKWHCRGKIWSPSSNVWDSGLISPIQ